MSHQGNIENESKNNTATKKSSTKNTHTQIIPFLGKLCRFFSSLLPRLEGACNDFI